MDILTVVVILVGIAILALVVIGWILTPGPSPLEKERESGKAQRQQGSTQAVARYLRLTLSAQDIHVTPTSIHAALDATPLKNEALSHAQQGLERSYQYYRRRNVPTYVQPSRRTVDLRYRELLASISKRVYMTIRAHRDFPQNVLIVSIYDGDDCIYSMRCSLDDNGATISAQEPGFRPSIALSEASIAVPSVEGLKRPLQYMDPWGRMEVRENKPSVYEKHPVVSFNEPLPTTLKYIRSLSPRQFEGLVRDLLISQGYHASLTRASADEGVDIIALRQGKRVLIQCKQYDKPVGVKHLRELYGAVAGEDAAPWFVTSSTFTEPALRFAKEKGILTINGQELLRLFAGLPVSGLRKISQAGSVRHPIYKPLPNSRNR